MAPCVTVQFRTSSLRFSPECRITVAMAKFDASNQGTETICTLRAQIVPTVYAIHEPSRPLGQLDGDAPVDACFAIRTNPQSASKTQHETSAPGRASWPNWTSKGDSAIKTPATRPARDDRISVAIRVTRRTEIAPNIADGNRNVHSSIIGMFNARTRAKYVGNCP